MEFNFIRLIKVLDEDRASTSKPKKGNAFTRNT